MSAATAATWLEELGRYRFIGDVQPCLSSSGAGFRFQVTQEAAHVWSDETEIERLLAKLVPAVETTVSAIGLPILERVVVKVDYGRNRFQYHIGLQSPVHHL